MLANVVLKQFVEGITEVEDELNLGVCSLMYRAVNQLKKK